MAEAAKAPRLRTILEFAEQEIILPDGPAKGRRFNADRQPYVRLLYDAIASHPWRKKNITGPSQSGKTLCAFVIPIMYYLFEYRENVICGLPDMSMMSDKWHEDIRPAITESRFHELLPKSGGGSRGGLSGPAVRFRNGATLRFMTGGGGDKSRAGFTSRILVITETDGMDEAGEGSREADKIRQLEARVRAFKKPAIWQECTVSEERGRTWQDYKAGTESKIYQQCPHCFYYVHLTRKDLHGWRDASDVESAKENSYFACYECGTAWSESDRRAAALNAVLVHRGQEIEPATGAITGERVRTDMLSFRWSAPDNLLVEASMVGADEYKAEKEKERGEFEGENAETEIRQFIWALPVKPGAIDLTSLKVQSIISRLGEVPRGVVPDDCEVIVSGADVSDILIDWVVLAFRADGSPHLVDCGVFEVPGSDLDIDVAVKTALRQYRAMLAAGFPIGTIHSKRRIKPMVNLVDSSWRNETIYDFVLDTGEHRKTWWPMMGYGASQPMANSYKVKKTTGAMVRTVGDQYHIAKFKKPRRVDVFEINADKWKTYVHDRLRTPLKESGAMTLFSTDDVRDHLSFAHHITAEKLIEKFVEGKGTIRVWDKIGRHNHKLDCSYMCCAAGHYAGVRLIGPSDHKPQETTHVTNDHLGSNASRGWFEKQRKRT